ncbi:hypothetical protein MUP77_04950 [Candidatus Bathyarchaeota archaeon]|nr:hypothetical protein [Candidatus Bathyarchaeota archaeon]
MDSAILYVRSKEISLGESPKLAGHHGHVATYTGPTAAGPNCYYDSQDQEAINLLNRSGIAYKLVDLSKCTFALRLKVKLSGWKTPTMMCSEKKVVGMENIKQALKEIEKEGKADA